MAKQTKIKTKEAPEITDLTVQEGTKMPQRRNQHTMEPGETVNKGGRPVKIKSYEQLTKKIAEKGEFYLQGQMWIDIAEMNGAKRFGAMMDLIGKFAPHLLVNQQQDQPQKKSVEYKIIWTDPADDNQTTLDIPHQEI